jgi:hypothetical protein
MVNFLIFNSYFLIFTSNILPHTACFVQAPLSQGRGGDGFIFNFLFICLHPLSLGERGKACSQAWGEVFTMPYGRQAFNFHFLLFTSHFLLLLLYPISRLSLRFFGEESPDSTEQHTG